MNNRKLAGLKRRLANKNNQQKPCVETQWWEYAECTPGVYAIFRKWRRQKPVYIGETCNLRERLRDLRNPANHTFTAQVTERYLNSTKSLDRIREYIENNYYVSFAAVDFGRKEFEEHLIECWGTSKKKDEVHPNKFNKSNPRWKRTHTSA